MKQAVRLEPPSFMERLIRLVYPAKCMICDRILDEMASIMLCDSCHELLPRCESGFVEMPSMPYVHKLFAAYYYDEGLDSAIHDMKFNHQPRLAETFGYLLYEEMTKIPLLPDWDMILPVPMHRSKKRKRGYNQSELLARQLSKLLQVPTSSDILVKIRSTRPQSKLKREERLINLEGAFNVFDDSAIVGKNILLIDDVATTGTTLNHCAKVLYERGAAFIFASVIAIVEK